MKTSDAEAPTSAVTEPPSRFRLAAPTLLEIVAERDVQRFLVTTSGGYFPILAALPTGRLVACVREGDFHVGQRGRLAAVISDDGGESWGYPISIDPRGPDDRNAAFGALPGGTLLCAFYRYGHYAGGVYQGSPELPVDVLVSRSIDGGETWSRATRIDSIAGQRFSAFGRIVILPDGTLLLPVYRSVSADDGGTGDGRTPRRRTFDACFVRSEDGGRTWSSPVVIAQGYNETALLPLRNGDLLAAVRSEETKQVAICRSVDSGASWSAPEPVTRPQELPGDLLQLADGRILVTYGHRKAPFGVRGMVSADDGHSWDAAHKVTLVADATSVDCGYPSSVQLADGSVLTAYYAVESRGAWLRDQGLGWHAGPGSLGPHCAVVKYRPEDLP